MKTALTIITGGSRGLGRAMAEQRLREGHRVLTLARANVSFAASRGEHTALTQDLADTATAASRLEAFLSEQKPAGIGSVALIHNAGVLSSLAPLSDNGAAELANAMRVGLEAPLVLSASFLRLTADWGVPRKLLLISSGLGRFAMAGSASYCAAKAGMDHLARALALEEAAKRDGARVVSLAPGVIDTDMQTQLRESDPTRFGARERFLEMKKSGQLLSPEAAARVLAFLDRADFGSNPVADTRESAS